MNIQPFKINISEEDLADLQRRLEQTRWPDEVDGTGWDYGANLTYMQALVTYWQTRFDWRAQEQVINSFAHFRADVDSLGIHLTALARTPTSPSRQASP